VPGIISGQLAHVLVRAEGGNSAAYQRQSGDLRIPSIQCGDFAVKKNGIRLLHHDISPSEIPSNEVDRLATACPDFVKPLFPS
jgi:hypothetical protein